MSVQSCPKDKSKERYYIIQKENITFRQIAGKFWTDSQHLAQFLTNYAWVRIKNIQSDKITDNKIGIEIHLKQKGGMFNGSESGTDEFGRHPGDPGYGTDAFGRH